MANNFDEELNFLSSKIGQHKSTLESNEKSKYEEIMNQKIEKVILPPLRSIKETLEAKGWECRLNYVESGDSIGLLIYPFGVASGRSDEACFQALIYLGNLNMEKRYKVSVHISLTVEKRFTWSTYETIELEVLTADYVNDVLRKFVKDIRDSF